MTKSLCLTQSRGLLLLTLALVAFPAAGRVKAPLHDAGELLWKGEGQRLFAHYAAPCQEESGGRRIANLSLVQAYDARTLADDEYRRFYARVIAPRVLQVCPGAGLVWVRHFVAGRFIAENGATSDNIQSMRERFAEIPLGDAAIAVDRAGRILSITQRGYASYLDLYWAVRARRGDEAERQRISEAERHEWVRRAKARFIEGGDRTDDVLICNRGDVEIAVANLFTTQGASAEHNQWWMRSWTLVKTNRCAGVSRGNGYSNLVFAQVGADYRLGIVRYVTDKTEIDERSIIPAFCISSSTVKENGAGRPLKYLPPCPAGTFLAPRSVTSFIQEWGGGDARYELTVKPTTTDRIEFAILNNQMVPWKPMTFGSAADAIKPLRLLPPGLPPVSQATGGFAAEDQFLLAILAHEIGTGANLAATVQQMRRTYGRGLHEVLGQLLSRAATSQIQLAKPMRAHENLGGFNDTYSVDALMRQLAVRDIKSFLIEIGRSGRSASGETIGLDEAIDWYDEMVAKHGKEWVEAVGGRIWTAQKHVTTWRGTTWDGTRYVVYLLRPEEIRCSFTQVRLCAEELLDAGN